VQLIDAYTQNFAHLGTRSTGNNGRDFMIAGPTGRAGTSRRNSMANRHN
jgi:hypothetical protein